MAGYFGDDAPSESVAKVVLPEIDGKNFELRDGAIFCLPCKKMFSGDNSINNLKHNIPQHEKTPCHQQKLSNVKNTRRIDTLFKPAKRSKTDI